MSAAYLFKRIVCILLVFCISLSLLPVNASLSTHSITSDAQATEASIIHSDWKNLAVKEIMPMLASEDTDLDKTVSMEWGNISNDLKASFKLQDEKSVTKDVHLSNDSKFTMEHEESFNSLINQLSTTGISLWSVMGDETVISPSGIDSRARVSYEINGPIYADYESTHTAEVKFKLNSPNEQEVSFAYTIYSGSASCGEHFDGAKHGIITFEIGETEKTLEINIPKLVNNPAVYETASDPGEFWTKDRVLYINCNNIRNALFDNEKESITVPVAIENQFDFKQSYQNAKDTYLVDLSKLSDVTSFPETPGKYLNTGNEIKVADESAISGDVRTVIDAGVFSHINMPIGYFSSEDTVSGAVYFKIDKNYNWGSILAFDKSILVDSNSKIDFNLGDIEISQIGLGPFEEHNGLIQSLNMIFDYSGLSQDVYTYFHDQNDNYLQKQINFTDKINPSVTSVAVPNDTFSFGENIPITVMYNEPVLIDDISIKANGTALYPVERTGTVSNNVSFLYEVKEDYENSIEITDIIGAIDLSGKSQEEAYQRILTDAILKPFDAEKVFAYCANTTVNINQGESINAKGEVVVSIKENIELSNWVADKIQPDRLLSVVKAKVIGKEGIPIDVPLYVNDGRTITELRGTFDAPANLSDKNNYYVAEIYFTENISDEFKLVYALSKEYAIAPIVYIDDQTDLEIVYTNWPSTNKILANSESPISLGYYVKNNATWQRPNDFSWSSSDETIATITETGCVLLTGQVGDVTFTLTALNAGLPGKEFSIYSKTLEVMEADTTFLRVPAGAKNIEIIKGNNAIVNYSTNITENNDSYAGSGTVTKYYYDLYEAEYTGSELIKGSLVHQQTLDATVDNNILSYTIDKQYLVNTAVRGKYSYILEISSRDLEADKILSASANICVKELPAKAILSRPQDYYVTDETQNIKVRFNIDNKNANTEFSLSVIKNEETAPIFSTNSIADIDKELTVGINAVDSNRLLDLYTVSLKARNEFDEAFSYDSYVLYVYNSNALKIMVNGTATDNLTMSINDKLSTMTSDEILALGRNISLTDEISINNKQYKWSNIADKITWEVGDDSKISLKYNDGGVYRNIEDYLSSSFLPGGNFLLQGKSSGNSFVTATHNVTGTEAKLNVTVDKIEDKLYIFQVYPAQKSTVFYTNGENKHKSVETDDRGRVAIYEKSGIKSDVEFKPDNTSLYDKTVIKYNKLVANQNSINDFGLYPQHNVILPLAQYKLTLYLYDNEYERYYQGDVIIRGGVYRNGVYCRDAKINGISGNVDQIVSVDGLGCGAYVLNFNPLEFTTIRNTNPLTPDDNIEYIIEVSFPDNSHYTKIIKVDNQTIKQYRNCISGVFLDESIKKLDSTKIQNNVSIVSQTVTIDGREQQIPELIIFGSKPESAVIKIEMMVPGDYNRNYEIEFVDEYGGWTLFSQTVKEAYEFSNTVTLRNTFDLRKRAYYMKPGEKANLYMNIRISNGVSVKEIKLPTPIKVQNLVGIPKMDTLSAKDLNDIANDIVGTIRAPYYVDFDGNDEQVKKTLDFLKDYSVNGNSIRLEIEPTDDPLVYKGVIKFAAGDLTRENPSGVYMADESSSETYHFMPGLSDMKAMKKGSYIYNCKDTMQKSKSGYMGKYKTYGGGAYLECEIFYDIDNKEWKILVLKSDVYIGAGGGYYHTYNTWAGPVPVTAEFRTGGSVQIGLKTIANKHYLEEKDEYDITRDYITELRPYFYIYGFGGFGQDYKVASLKIGPYGQISIDQRYLWHNQGNTRTDGQKITISGKTGIKFQASVLFINYTKKYELGGISKSWKYNDYDKIESIYNSKSEKMFFGSYSEGYVHMDLEPVSETVTFEDRSYLNTFDRQWYVPMIRSFLDEGIDEGITVIQTNAYPQSNPVLTDDGKIMAYISDMDSTDINDTAVCFTKKDDGGVFPEGQEIDVSDYADTDVVIDGTGNSATVAWTRVISDFGKSAGEEATSEDIQSMMSDTEIMASIYNGTNFTTTRLTNNSTPDMAPVVATSGNKAIVAWRSLYASDMENPLDFDGRDNIMYSIFDGTGWSEAKCLYDGSIDKVKAVNAEMLSDGTSAITYQIKIKGTENTEIICAVLDEDGNIINNIRLTNNEIKDENPRITSVVFSDNVERFIIGWNTVKTISDDSEENIIRLSAVNSKGVLYPQFEKEIESTVDASNYNSFKFTKGAKKLEDLSIVWTEPKQETDAKTDSIYKDIIWGRKFIQEDSGNIIESPKIKLLEFDNHNVVDFFNSYVDNDTKEINFALLISDYSSTESQVKLATAKSGYKNNLVVEETYFSQDDLLPGLDMPVLFSLYNEGVEPIKKVTITLAGVSHEFESIIKSGEYKNFTVFYTVPETIVNPDYSIIAQFSTSMDTKSGTLNMDVPDVGIYNIDITKEMERERMFSVQLRNNTFSKLTEGKHIVKLEVYDTPDFNYTPIVTKTISDDESLGMINDGIFIQNIALSEENLQGILDDYGEIPREGSRIYFNVIVDENGTVIDDADISNNTDYVKIHSLLVKNGKPISFTSLMQAEADHTVVQVEAFNNSMNNITNGNIIVNLRDHNGNVIETKQTYNPSNIGSGLIALSGEETFATTFNFSKTGASSDAIFSSIVDDSLLLSELKFSGVPLDFDKNVYAYELQVKDLNKTLITVVPENPNANITIFKNGQIISILKPCDLHNRENIFEIVVRNSTNEVTYTVNIKVEFEKITEEDIQVNPKKEPEKEYENPFQDVFKSEWFYEAVQFAYENGLMSGTSEDTFSPNVQTTRGMLVTILYRMEHEPSVNTSGFTDVADGAYYAKAVAWARENGIVYGVSETEFAPNISITREQLAVIFYRYTAFKGYDTSKRGDISIYADSNMISDYAVPAMQWAVGTGLITGRSETETDPKENATRAEMTVILQRFIELVVKAAE